jgi:DUF4097 and DUF4098 domain-containing protein YvlB
MVYPIRFWAIVLAGLLLWQFSTEAVADWCKYEKEFDLTLDVSDSEILAITAVAGDLEITGVAGSKQATIKGKACVSKEKWLEDVAIETSTGKTAEITARVSDSGSSDFCIGICYRSLDLHIEVPDGLELKIKDSSGPMVLEDIGPVAIEDSSGEIEINGALGNVMIRDSSGDIDIDGLAGDLTVESDSSGGIFGRDIEGAVLVERDSSGNIKFTGVGGDVVVERDSSGNITVTDVGGNFRVLKDGSGSINSNNVKGEVVIPEDH